jgi:hypothetical protein
MDPLWILLIITILLLICCCSKKLRESFAVQKDVWVYYMDEVTYYDYFFNFLNKDRSSNINFIKGGEVTIYSKLKEPFIIYVNLESNKKWYHDVLNNYSNFILVKKGKEVLDNIYEDGLEELEKLINLSKYTFIANYDPNYIDYKTVFPYPIGVTTQKGFKNPETIKPILERKYLASFVGSIRTNKYRSEVIKPYLDNPKFHIRLKNSWSNNDKDIYKKRFKYGLINSKFILCLEGANPETYRFLESMYYGAIPVVVSSPRMEYTLKMYKYYSNLNLPIILLDSWDNLEFNLSNISDKRLTELQSDIKVWLDKFETKVYNKLAKTAEKL